jgi:hypothetical protein
LRRMAIYASAKLPNTPRPLSCSNPFLVHRNRKRKKMMLRNLITAISKRSHHDRGLLYSFQGAYRSMFSDSNWLLAAPFFAVKLLRKLTGILEVPGILGRVLMDDLG